MVNMDFAISGSQVKALLRKDVIVRLRQPWMPVVQLLWPCMVFMLLYLIRLKFGPEQIEDCQFPTRLLPTKNHVLPSFYSYICSLENKCVSTENYEEYSKWENAPMKPIIDIINVFVTDDRMFSAVIDLPVKFNFINAVTAVVTGGHFNEIRQSVTKIINLVPQVEEFLNGTFDIKRLFADRSTFVKAGYLLCGHPFPSTDTIPLVNDILYDTEDFSKINDDELTVMPTKYCKQLYLNITGSTTGKLTWSIVKPLIHGKILYAPISNETDTIMKFANSTFEELNRLQRLSVAVADIVTKLREDESFQKSFDSLLKLATSQTVRAYIGEDINIDQIVMMVNRIRYDPIVYDIVFTIKNILECFSVDRFVPLFNEKELQLKAYELNQKRLFFAAAYFNHTNKNVVYKLHMDTENTQPTFENKNRFWFPGPSRSIVRDMKYHRGFVQIKQAIDMAIINYQKSLYVNETDDLLDGMPVTTRNPISVEVYTGDEDDENDWLESKSDDEDSGFLSQPSTENITTSTTTIKPETTKFNVKQISKAHSMATTRAFTTTTTTTPSPSSTTTTPVTTPSTSKESLKLLPVDDGEQVVYRKRRQALLDLLSVFGSNSDDPVQKYGAAGLEMYTKQFPYPAYIHDDMKTGLYLAQAIQVAFFLGLVAEIASCVRHFIWMRESRNTMLMCCMGLKPCSELVAWVTITFVELFVIFCAVMVILYVGGILMYSTFVLILLFLIIFGACLIAFCYMCSSFFTSATIGAVATALLFFISYCPYIIVLLFDTQLNSLQNFCISLSFTTAFSHAWSHIMRAELQQTGLGFIDFFTAGVTDEFGYGLLMIILDMLIYMLIGYLIRRYKSDEYRFIVVQREDLDASVGATMTNVSKLYDENIAVSDINLSLPRDKITCLLGRNGAGKSTIIKMITGQVVQSTGRVILSQAMSSAEEYDKVGVCSQDNILIPNLTAREHLELYASIKLNKVLNEVDDTLSSLKFGKYEGYQACQLSGGYQRRLCVALAFIASPNVVILDEPCNGVDSKARKDIWELIQNLRKGRAVMFATHFLDEAEYLSDGIVIMHNGKIICKHNPDTLKAYSTSFFEVSMQCYDMQTANDVKEAAQKQFTEFKEVEWTKPGETRLQIPYDQESAYTVQFLTYLQKLQNANRIAELSIDSRNLGQIFEELHGDNAVPDKEIQAKKNPMQSVELKRNFCMDSIKEGSLQRKTAISNLLWKRFVHFSRNYRILICVIALPALFELLAMWFVTYRLEDDFDKTISLSRDLYPQTTQMLSMDVKKKLTQSTYDSFAMECSQDAPCEEFSNSSKAFYWILNTVNQYQERRYGGYSFNDTNAIVWYNNKGYHAMMAWLNDLNTHLLQAEVNDNNFTITTLNEPWKLGHAELSTTSVLRQAGDSSMVFILIIAFSLIVAVASVFLVNERVKGEKLQQKLCGVDLLTYWSVAFVWDFLVMCLGIMVCVAIILSFNLPIFMARQNLWGILALAFLFAFSSIPAVHVFEKCFNDSSVAIVTIFCMNIIVPLFTMAIIVLLGVVGDSQIWDDWRYFLNRAFLIFPQHALGDGLLEICKNYMVSLVFQRYDIDSYKNPLNSDLLLPHYLALGLLGVFFIWLNFMLELGYVYRCKEFILERFVCRRREDKQLDELKIVSIQNSLKRTHKDETPQVLKVDNLCKSYNRGQYVVKNVTFAVKSGECFGLLGKNGSGKSTIFKMLSGELVPNMGAINYFNGDIAYCPQTNPLDSLLTVEEAIRFYGNLRRVIDVPKLITNILESFQLKSYRHVLVKNLSGGNRRKLTVALTCCGRTTVVLLDEPTSDMDPMTRALVYDTIQELFTAQRAVVLTSHSVSEIEEICHRIAVLKDGQIVTCSTPESLKAQYGGFYNVVIYAKSNMIAKVETSIRKYFPDCIDVQLHPYAIKFSLKIDNYQMANGSKLRENGIDIPEKIDRIEPETYTLAGLFKALDRVSKEYEQQLRYTVSHCRLDTVFERILDSSDQHMAFCNGTKVPVCDSPSTGYVHNGYVETETAA